MSRATRPAILFHAEAEGPCPTCGGRAESWQHLHGGGRGTTVFCGQGHGWNQHCGDHTIRIMRSKARHERGAIRLRDRHRIVRMLAGTDYHLEPQHTRHEWVWQVHRPRSLSLSSEPRK